MVPTVGVLPEVGTFVAVVGTFDIVGGKDTVGEEDGSAVVGLCVGDRDGEGVGRIETDGSFDGCVDGSSDVSFSSNSYNLIS